jgi:23S rRNA (adenine(2503)-C(2))-methyltransferase
MVKRRQLRPKPIFDEPALHAFLQDHGVKFSHAGKIWKHVVANPDCLLDDIPGIPNNIRVPLAQQFVACTSSVVKCEQSALDGTLKLLIRLQDGRDVEAVVIRHSGEAEDPAGKQQERCGRRLTLCVSSQVGCRLGCTFCATGTMGLEGNLWAGEIVEQLVHARQRAGIQNIVFMGMGEPLENYDGVVSAIKCLTDPQCFSLAPSHVTVSTVGLIGNMKRLMADLPHVRLALSLHAPNQKLREQLLPVAAKAYKLGDLMTTIDDYAARHASDGKRHGSVMVSYVLLKGVNDSDKNAQELRDLLCDRPVIVNLIPYNAFEGNKFKYECPSVERTDSFLKILLDAGMRVFERRHHGRDISAACGQLARVEKQQVVDLEDVSCMAEKDKLISKSKPRRPVSAKSSMMFHCHSSVAFLAAAFGGVTCCVLWQRWRRHM